MSINFRNIALHNALRTVETSLKIIEGDSVDGKEISDGILCSTSVMLCNAHIDTKLKNYRNFDLSDRERILYCLHTLLLGALNSQGINLTKNDVNNIEKAMIVSYIIISEYVDCFDNSDYI